MEHKKQPKIMIAVPCMDQVPAPFCQSVSMIQKVGETAIAFQMGSLIYNSRNNLALKSLEIGADYVMWLDSDQTFNPDLLQRMHDTLTKNDLDILSGLYFRRTAPYSPVVFDKLEMRDDGVCEWTDWKDKPLPDELFEVGGCGFGCVLIKTDVFFDVQSKYGDMFGPINRVGEDLSFCWRARQCGYKIYCDPSIICGHVGYAVIDERFYREYNQAIQSEKGVKDGNE